MTETGQSEVQVGGRLGAWCGWVLAGTLALAPLVAWLAPLALAPLVGIAGGLCLPALRVRKADWPQVLALLVIAAYAALSMLWSPYAPDDLEGATALKLFVQILLYWSAFSAARAAAPRARLWALRVFAVGMALLGLVLLAEGLTGAAIYQHLRAAIGDPIREDLARRNIGQAAFVVAVLWPFVCLAGHRALGRSQLGLLPVAGAVAVGWGALSDAPVMAMGAGALVGLAVLLRWTAATRAMATLTAVFFIVAPMAVWGIRAVGWYAPLEAAAPVSWGQRMVYWRHAQDLIFQHPVAGWGLDASRTLAPAIELHPHDAALQLWLELGVLGAAAAALFWVGLWLRLDRGRPSFAAASGAASAVAFLVFLAVSFGVWQEWFLALGAVAAVAFALVDAQPPRVPARPSVA